MKTAILQSIRDEAGVLRKQIVEGGSDRAPLAPTTLAARQLKGIGGSKGSIRKSITVTSDGDSTFVGVRGSARGKDGKGLAKAAEVQEFGAGPFTVRLTPKMRKFLFAMLKKAGMEPTGSGGGKGAVVITIPPRPFLRPAFEAFKKKVRERILERVAGRLGFKA